MSEAKDTRRVAAVTGGLCGIGRGIVLALTECGFDVVARENEHAESAGSIISISSSNTAIAAPEHGEYAMLNAVVATTAAGDLPFTTRTEIQVDGGMHIHQY